MNLRRKESNNGENGKKRIVKKVVAILTASMAISTLTLTGCGAGKTDSISVVSREDGSGTRGAFTELTGVSVKDKSGNTVDSTTDNAIISNSTEIVMSTVSGDKNAIGYISLGSLNNTVKALKCGGVEASADNIDNGTYKISRPFNIVTKDDLSDVASDFISFIMSNDGQKIVSDSGYIKIDASGDYSASSKSGKIVIAGSSSVTPLMEKLTEAYEKLNPDVDIQVQESDSTTGVNSAISGSCDIGMASRELADTESSQGITATAIAKDGIVVIVNKANDKVDDLSLEQIKKIFTGEISSWSDIG